MAKPINEIVIRCLEGCRQDDINEHISKKVNEVIESINKLEIRTKRIEDWIDFWETIPTPWVVKNKS